MFRRRTFFHRASIFAALISTTGAVAQTDSTSQPGNGATGKVAATSNQPSTCEGAFAAFGVKLPTGVTAAQVCPSITTAVNDTVMAVSQDGNAARTIIYSKEEAGFYKALSRSLKKYGGKSEVQVTFASNLTPAVTLATIQAAAAPSYEESGLGIWLDRIEDSGGKVCRKQSSSSGLVGSVLPFVLQFFAKTVVPFLISKYNAATAYSPAKKLNAIVVYDPRDSANGRITEIDFIPRSAVDPCPGAQ